MGTAANTNHVFNDSCLPVSLCRLMLLDCLIGITTVMWYLILLAENITYRGLVELRRLSLHPSDHCHSYYWKGQTAHEEPQPKVTSDRAKTLEPETQQARWS
jgi:hypothetical protein